MRFGPLRAFSTVLISFIGIAAPASAWAAPPRPSATAATPPTPPPPPPPPPEDPHSPAGKLAEARQRYDAGLQLYDRGDYDAARVEFERANQLAPSYRIFYNLGLILEQKADYVAALKNFRSYLDEGGTQIPDMRKTQVLATIEELKKRVATVRITTNVTGATVLVDDVEVGKTPMKEPVLVNPGRRRVGAMRKGYLPSVKVVDAAGQDNIPVVIQLTEEKVFVVEKPTRRVPWVGWGISAAFAVTAGLTGYVALNASSDLKDERGNRGVDPARLTTLANRSKTFGAIADIGTLGAVVAGGISLYYTIKWGHEYNEQLDERPQQGIRLQPTPSGIMGSF